MVIIYKSMSESEQRLVESLSAWARELKFSAKDLGQFQSAKKLDEAMARSVAATGEIAAPVAQTAEGRKFLGIKD